MQCCLELSNIDKIVRNILPTCAMLFQRIKTTSNRTFFCTILSEASWETLLKIFTSERLSRKYSDSNEQDYCPLQCCLEPLGQHAQSFYLCNVVPRVLRQLWTGFFSGAMLSGDSWTTLNRIFSGAMSSKEY